ncbi:TonB-dependent siderophore receptor [Verrucomicrobium spinosum]|uniref:TonB-dependent siderophore receptor n=2 Tax=Verrucomicrobium spinosum TaxID=2736 RepID=UPI000174534F|nr:TonB-dependent receptor [Verrucomicrobium spinosum]
MSLACRRSSASAQRSGSGSGWGHGWRVRLTLFACLAGLQGPILRAEKSDARFHFTEPAGDLAEALDRFSRVTKLDVVARGDLLAGRRAPAVEGRLTAEEALLALLKDSGFEARFTGDSAVAVVPAAGGSARLLADLDSGHLLNEVVVTDFAERAYTAESASTGTRLEMPLRDLPQTVNVVPQDLLQDRAVLRPAELADSVAGVRAFTGYGGISSGDFFIRGFGTGTSYRNGYRDFSFLSPVDFAGVERVEFLKGPGSVLYGEGQPGGVVNYLSKKPVAAQVRELTLTMATDEVHRAALDLGGTFIPARQGESEPVLMYRWNSAYEDAGSHRDYGASESLFLSPAVSWQVTVDTSLTLLGEYHRYDYVFDRGLLAVPQALKVPVRRFLGEPEDEAKTDAWRAGYELKHRFSEAWQFRSGFALILSEQTSRFAQPYEVAPDGRKVLRQATARRERSQNYTLQNELSGRVNTGPVRHDLLLGVELSRYQFRYEIGFMEMSAIDFFHPVYDAPLPTAPYDPLDGYGADSLGLYVQDLVTLSPQWKLLLGMRHDTSRSREFLSGHTHDDRAWSPRAGLVYQPWGPLSLYAGWSHSFNPNFGISRDGGGFDPEEGEQMEAGLKLELLDQRVTAGLSVYEITKSNVLVPDLAAPEFASNTGAQKSRGMEVEVAGTPVRGWKVSLNYACTDAFVSEDTAVAEGTRLAGIPRHEGGFWSTYEWQSGRWKGFGMGTGLAYASDRPATLAEETVMLPSAWRWDAALFYRRDSWSAQVNFKNITGERIYQSQGALIYPEALLQVQASVTVKF